MRTVIVHGPQGCGKTRNAKALAEAFGCREVIDGWYAEGDAIVPGALHLTNQYPIAIPSGVETMGFDAAKDILKERGTYQ